MGPQGVPLTPSLASSMYQTPKLFRGTWCPPMPRLQIALLLLRERSQCPFRWVRSSQTCIRHPSGEAPSTSVQPQSSCHDLRWSANFQSTFVFLVSLCNHCGALCLFPCCLPILYLHHHHQSSSAR